MEALSRAVRAVRSMWARTTSALDRVQVHGSGRGWLLGCVAFYTLVIIAYFSRGLARGDLLASEDARSEYFPQFTYPYSSWTRLLFSGYPLFADPQNMSFLPARVLFSPFGAWNIFVLSAYVIAACCACAYAYELTRDRRAALAAGLIYGATGHMLRNFTLVPMVQSMAWAPLVFWALERLVRNASTRASVIGAVALASTCLGGYGQIAAYTGAMTVAYAAMGLFRAAHRVRYLSHAALLFGLGVLLSAVQWLPTLELALQSRRTHMTYEEAVGWGWTFIQSAELLMSRVFLGPWSAASLYPGCGVAGDADHAYFGLMPLILAASGAWLMKRSAVTWFWCVVGLFSLALAFGDNTPVARWAHAIPPYSLFRVLVRHSMFLAIGVSILSAFALAGIQSGPAERQHVRRVYGWASFAIAASFVAAATAVLRRGCGDLTGNGLMISFLALTTSIVVLALWARSPTSLPRTATLIGCIALDLLTFDGWGGPEPRYAGRSLVAPAEFSAPQGAAEVATELAANHQRMWAVNGVTAGRSELPVNLNLLWNIPSAAGYSPIAPTHSLNVLDMSYYGKALGPFWDERSLALDVSAVRLITIADPAAAPAERKQGVRWATDDFESRLGQRGRGDVATSMSLRFPPRSVTAVGLVMDMEFSSSIRQLDQVAVLQLRGERSISLTLNAGADVSEWAIDCPSEQAQTRHGRAPLFDARPVRLHDADCTWNRYVTIKRLDEPVAASSLDISWVSDARDATLRVHKVSVVSQEDPDGMPLDDALSALLDDPRWKPRAPLGAGRSVFENRRALPRARFVDATVEMPNEQALNTLRTGQLPSGERYDATAVALVPSGAGIETHRGCQRTPLEWLEDRDGLTSFSVNPQTPCFLVLADTFYNGWTVHIDGKTSAIHRTNVAFRGVEVPVGQHRVEFKFASAAFLNGACISGVSVLAIGGVFLGRRKSRASTKGARAANTVAR